MLCDITQNAMGQTPRGVPISHNALQHYPEFHRADTRGNTLPGPARGVPCQRVPCWGYPARGVPCQQGTLLGGTLPGGTLPGVPCPGGYPAGGYSAGGIPCQGGTQLGQQKEYSLHGRRYASCVHTGGLSCYSFILKLSL